MEDLGTDEVKEVTHPFLLSQSKVPGISVVQKTFPLE